jgi:hypothetical protein
MSDIQLSRSYSTEAALSSTPPRRVQYQLDQISNRSLITQAQVSARAEVLDTQIVARNALAARAAKADADLGSFLAALPLHDVTDVDFHAQLQQAARAGAIRDVYGFGA